MKYFVLGAFSSAFFLYGIALIYGATGTTNLDRHLRVPADDGAARGQAAAGRHGPAARRPRVQGRRGAVPLVDARRLRGCAHAGHRVLRRRRPRRPPSPPCCGSSSRPSPTYQDDWQPAVFALAVAHPAGRGDPGHRADQREADDGVLVDQPRRLHPRRGRAGHGRRHLGLAALPAGLRRDGHRDLRRHHRGGRGLGRRPVVRRLPGPQPPPPGPGPGVHRAAAGPGRRAVHRRLHRQVQRDHRRGRRRGVGAGRWWRWSPRSSRSTCTSG